MFSIVRSAMRGVAPLVLVLLLAASCTAADQPIDESGEPTATAAGTRPQRQFRAEWLIDAEAIGAQGPGFPFAYREIVDDRQGRYLVQGPEHIAIQSPEEVVFCAAIFRIDPYCASIERAESAPHVLSFPVQLLRNWGPTALYDLAGWREVDLAERVDQQAWNRRTTVSSRGINVECFAVVGQTAAANAGFEVCFTDDDQHLVATVDLQGDAFYEIDLVRYERSTSDEDFVTGLESWIEPKASLHEQLLRLYPEVPAPRPTSVPTVEGEIGDT